MRAPVLTLLVLAAVAAGQDPEWIWHGPAGADDRIYTCHPVQVAEGLEKAVLTGSCDNATEVFLGGKSVARSSEWSVPFRVDVTERLAPGTTALAAQGRNEGGPAGLWLQLELEYQDGARTRLVTDASWRVSREPTERWMLLDGPRAGWSGATSFGALGVGPWGTPQRYADGRGSQALPADQLVLPAGFAAELLYSVPKETQGSWVVLCFDDRGRILASDQYGALYRMTPPPIGAADGQLEVEPLDVAPGRAQGLLWAFDSLYVVVAEGGAENGLYRVRDTDGDDRFDEIEHLKFLKGGGEHGPHAVILGPDGDDLYVIAGNHVPLPAGITRSRPTRVWAEDQLLPRHPDPNGHANGVLAPGGWVCRIDPDATRWELVAIGMRNAYDMAFNPDGELFTFDSDMEWDVGLPWYRPTRVLHLVSGADFGWRFGSGKWPAHYPDSLPAAVDIGLSSPTGVVFGTEAAFHGDWRKALFVADWAYGQVFAVQLEPAGGSYRGSFVPFASGKPFQVTDLAIGPDGAMYVTTGGRRTQSGLYRIRSTAEPAPRPGRTRATPERSARRVLERNHGLGTPSPFWSELGAEDRFLAHAARTALEQTPVPHWADAALTEDDPRVALQALIGLVRVAPDEYGTRVLERLHAFPVAGWGPELTLDYLRLLSLAYIRTEHPPAELAASFARQLAPLFPAGHAALDRELCRVLVFLQAPRAAEEGLRLLAAAEAAGDQETQIHYALCLSSLESGWTQPLRRRYFRWLNRVGPNLSGGHSLRKYVEGMRAAALERLPEELRAHPELLAPPPPEVATPVPPAATFVRAWTMADLTTDLDAVRAGRDYARGRDAYRKATCTECHRLASEGGSTGPDLTGAGGRFSPLDLLETLLEPSKTIPDQYQELEVVTKEDVLHVGRVAQEEGGWLVLRGHDDQLVEIELTEIALRRPHPISRMPAGLLDVLERDEVLDLLAFVLAGGEEDDPAFRR